MKSGRWGNEKIDGYPKALSIMLILKLDMAALSVTPAKVMVFAVYPLCSNMKNVT